jgi:hypothetical protein
VAFFDDAPCLRSFYERPPDACRIGLERVQPAKRFHHLYRRRPAPAGNNVIF